MSTRDYADGMISSQAAFQPNAQPPHMNCELLRWAAAQKLPHSQHSVLVILALHTDADGAIAITKGTIAAQIDLTERQVHTILGKLGERGLLEVSTQKRIGRGRPSNVYRLSVSENPLNEADFKKSASGTGLQEIEFQKSASGSQLPETETPHIEHAGVRARHPANNTISEIRDSSERGVRGEDFALDGKPASRAKPKRQATESSMPKKPTAKMIEYAAAKEFYNGTVTDGMFPDWRNYHIAKGTTIADHEASWRTWVDKRVEFRVRDASPTKRGYKPIGVGEDGVMRYEAPRTHYR